MKKNWVVLAIGIAVVVVALVVVKLVFSKGEKKSVSFTEVASGSNFDTLVKNATALQESGELLKAQEAFKNIMASFASRPGIEDVQKKLEDVNMKIIVSAINVPNQTATYEVKEDDSLNEIAKAYNTTIAFIKKENGLNSDIIRPGMRLRIWTGKFSILVDKSQNILMLKSNGEVVKTYRVSTGKNNITPAGTFKIVNKLVNPSWTHEGKLIPYGNPENILGTRWMGFDIPTYGIHGTTLPETIGQQATAGCVRMLNREVEELYDIIPAGTEITIMD